ncbi:hypothetical protein DYB38_001963 [Aphanomyces astaci]|uniref:Uncharacterized protein n=1 Tax=Aphanomyces astaci TaxID=112090 RepID=A0A397D025_APHAT|nr:hypothetical protein DYB38_001963 [Aphanomyces astaci]
MSIGLSVTFCNCLKYFHTSYALDSVDRMMKQIKLSALVDRSKDLTKKRPSRAKRTLTWWKEHYGKSLGDATTNATTTVDSVYRAIVDNDTQALDRLVSEHPMLAFTKLFVRSKRCRVEIHFSEPIWDFVQDDIQVDGCQVTSLSMYRADFFVAMVDITAEDDDAKRPTVQIPPKVARRQHTNRLNDASPVLYLS